MRLESIFKYALFLVPLYFPTCMLQIITEIDVPELQLLASNLKPEECIQFISLDSQFPLSDEEVQKLAREQSCFRNLVKWICQLRTVTKNTWPVVNERLERIGRKDLVACLTEFKMKTSKSPKVIREVQLAEDSEGDEGVATAAVPPTTPKGTDANATTQNANQTINKFRERNVDDDVPCIRHLIHWNSSPTEGKGKTHEALTHRLRQINRNDLADWLGKSTFTQLGKDLSRAVGKSFDELAKEESDSSSPILLASKSYDDADPWLQVDIVLLAILLGLLGALITLICATIFHKMRNYFRNKYKFENHKIK
ncbi:uncharacterized protein LOC143221185 isoform X2 [Lasioglossum baleicum]|uniref:uncharacterized protein LOC143221185 isoform X2 n=1 Tax=Lasioglossum baleicum TaxID=434251 RepID=UPI003FCC9234